MEDYGRDFSSRYAEAALMLLMDIPTADKEALAIRLCQIGIDMYGVFETGAEWGDDGGGHCTGRRLPVILAGYLLGYDTLRDYFIGKDKELTGESIQAQKDDQGYYWRERPRHSRSDPGSTGYITQTANVWCAMVIVLRALGLEEAWDHEPTFGYVEGHMAKSWDASWKRAWKDWYGSLYSLTDGGRHAP
jgi:hypothetical protein